MPDARTEAVEAMEREATFLSPGLLGDLLDAIPTAALVRLVIERGGLLPDGRTLCRDHRPGCTGCGGWLEDPTESPRCMDCEPEDAAGTAPESGARP